MSSSLHPLVVQSRQMVEELGRLESTRERIEGELKRELEQREELERELTLLRSRLKMVEDNLLRGEEDKKTLEMKVEQGKMARNKIEEGMRVLLDTLEREDRVDKRVSGIDS